MHKNRLQAAPWHPQPTDTRRRMLLAAASSSRSRLALATAGAGGGTAAIVLALSPAAPAAPPAAGGAAVVAPPHIDDGTISERLRKLQLDAREALGVDAASRFSRTLYQGLLTSIDYKMSMRGLEPGSDAYVAKRQEVNLRAANRILYVCQQHGGVYTKAGQYLSSLVKILPDEYTDTLRVLQDANPGEPFDDVRRVIQEDFGTPLADLYASFEPTPIAAASLAQVHRAVTADGQTVAVKVQYPRLETQTRGDVWTLRTLATVVGALFKDYEYTWLLPEFEESITLELDFLQEATNAERIAALFAGNDRIHIPTIRWDLSTHRVLTMEFIEGIKVTNTKALEAQRMQPVAVGETISTLFSLMVFYLGLVHCDPHAGNILIRPHPPPPPSGWRLWDWARRAGRRAQEAGGLKPNYQVVLLDHGMYRRLTETFRYSYCQLWRAFMTRDDALGKRATRALGLNEEFFELLSIISVNRTPRSKSSLGAGMSEEERQAVREKYRDREKYSAEALRNLIEGLPRDVLFVLRSNSLVRSLNSELGAGVGSRFRIFGSSACFGLSMPYLESLPPAYFLSELRAFSLVVAGVPGRVLQQRRKVEMLRMPEASLNKATAAEAFLFTRERRPLLQELRRQLTVADMRLRIFAVDSLIELLLWARRTSHLVSPEPPQPKGEELAEKQLHMSDDDRGMAAPS